MFECVCDKISSPKNDKIFEKKNFRNFQPQNLRKMLPTNKNRVLPQKVSLKGLSLKWLHYQYGFLEPRNGPLTVNLAPT